MPGRRVSIAVVMNLTAFIALNLGVVRVIPEVLLLFQFPPSLFLILALELALFQLACDRPLGTFYYTFLIVGSCLAVLIVVVTIPAEDPRSIWFQGSLHILETPIQYYRAGRGQSQVISPYEEFPMLAAAEGLLLSGLTLVPAWAAAALASWWMRGRSKSGNK